VLFQSPSTRYLVGMLAPRGTAADSSEDESLESESDEDGEDGAVRLSASLDPSSIGLSCVVDPSAGQIQVMASWGEYTKVERAEETDPEDSTSIDRDADPDATVKRPQKQYEWRRIPFEKIVSLPTQPTERSETEPLGPGVALEWTCRRIGEALVISLFLMNCREAAPDKRPPDELWLYQPKLELTGAGAPFLPRARLRDSADPDPDVASADLIYATKREFSTGHGVATNWSTGPDGDRATKIWTEIVPAAEVPLLEPRGGEGLPSMSMDDLANTSPADLDRLIAPLLDAYGVWISEREAEVGDIPEIDRAVGADHLLLARQALKRMRAGAELLKRDVEVLAAFRFANAAMAEQRRHTATVLSLRRGESPPADIPVEWRPFQIGFILLCLVGLVDEVSDDLVGLRTAPVPRLIPDVRRVPEVRGEAQFRGRSDFEEVAVYQPPVRTDTCPMCVDQRMLVEVNSAQLCADGAFVGAKFDQSTSRFVKKDEAAERWIDHGVGRRTKGPIRQFASYCRRRVERAELFLTARRVLR
jgi:hypothetical protein